MTLFTPRALKGIAATFTAALMLASCSTGSSDSTTAPETSNANGSEERIVTMGLGDVDTVLALGEQPVGYATWQQEGSGDPSGLGPWAKDKLTVDPNPIRDTTTEFSTDTAERVASLNPTKIIAVNSGLEADKKALLEQIAPTTFHSDAYEDWQVPWDEQIKEISKALNKEAEGEKLIADSEQAFQDFREAHPELQGKTAVIGMPYDGKFGVYTSGDGRGSFIEKLGFKIPEKFNGDGSSFFLDWSPENYVDFNDVDYLFVLDYYGAIDALKNDEKFMDLDVNKRGGVYWLDTDTANAMSMPNPLTIPYAIEQIKKSL
ncbi:iron-siderophore ABC transporter substrate-binding protein [Corynebacterium sp. NML98-0116]|uniref:iron-siderophore ABC transporter substrate-binding protein n=1 Tax=Corynebacterium sp. NML98-0116 TaxID=702967 RepID=UPI000AB74E95|nr:iron-siderophore ABC transporter substrate-binding protein [Corynebacterium sp. NML98-0116]